MLLGQHHLLIDNLRVGENLRQAHDPAARHPGGVEPLDPVLGRRGAEPRLDLGVDRGAVRHPQIVRAKARVVAQFGRADRIDETLIGLLLARRQRDLAVLNMP